MKTQTMTQSRMELEQLCATVRAFVIKGMPEGCIAPISQAMARYPHAPQPHNLMGIVLEKTGDHSAAMKHFRAAWALDPSYLPANHNLHTYGTFFSGGSCAFDEDDLPPAPKTDLSIEYNEQGIGHTVYKSRIAYDEKGIGHVVRR